MLRRMAMAVVAATWAQVVAAEVFVSADGAIYAESVNGNGTVLRGRGETIYLGRACDALIEGLGYGRWGLGFGRHPSHGRTLHHRVPPADSGSLSLDAASSDVAGRSCAPPACRDRNRGDCRHRRAPRRDRGRGGLRRPGAHDAGGARGRRHDACRLPIRSRRPDRARLGSVHPAGRSPMPAPSFAEIEAPDRDAAAALFVAALGWRFAAWRGGDGLFATVEGFQVGVHRAADGLFPRRRHRGRRASCARPRARRQAPHRASPASGASRAARRPAGSPSVSTSPADPRGAVPDVGSALGAPARPWSRRVIPLAPPRGRSPWVTATTITSIPPPATAG